MDCEDTNSTVDRRLRRRSLAKKTGACDRCPPHAKENEGRKAKSDKHKNHRRK